MLFFEPVLRTWSAVIATSLLLGAVALGCLRACEESAAETLTCEARGKTCGELRLRDGTAISCGTCSEREVCGMDGIENVCCVPTSCEEQGTHCGTMSDGCGGTVECGTCPQGQVCGGDGEPNRCAPGGCVVRACEPGECGQRSDGCGGIVSCGGCSDGQSCGGSGLPGRCGVRVYRAPEVLARGCLGWPEEEFTPRSYSPHGLGIWTGGRAVDFELAAPDGQRHRLGELLRSKPVMLQLGSATCPTFRSHLGELDQLMAKYADRVHFVTVYTLEAHPAAPDPSPFRGRVFKLRFSEHRQPRTIEARRDLASKVPPRPGHLVLVDDLDNPVWCTYGPAPNAAFLIDKAGVVRAAHLWFDPPTMASSIDALLGEPSN